MVESIVVVIMTKLLMWVPLIFCLVKAANLLQMDIQYNSLLNNYSNSIGSNVLL